MFKSKEQQVLVAGAGPVGMLTALHLASAGIRVTLIDQETGPGEQSYACAIHSRPLEILNRFGLTEEVIRQSVCVNKVGFFEDTVRFTELDLSSLPVPYPFVAVLPQNRLEALLQDALRKRGVKILWNHRLAEVEHTAQGVVATVHRMGETGQGYGFPTVERSIQKTLTLHAEFLVGADGADSVVRARAGLEFEALGPRQLFAVFDVRCDREMPNEMAVAFHNETVNSLWPLGGWHCRWTIRLPDVAGEDPGSHLKDRVPYYFSTEATDAASLAKLEALVAERAPWFNARFKAIEWTCQVGFQRRLARKFGQGRIWLAGDSAHQTSPVAMQSLNQGLHEAELLARLLGEALHDTPASMAETLARYEQCRGDWLMLLGLRGGLRCTSFAPKIASQHRAELLACFPATGPELIPLAAQLDLELLVEPTPLAA